MTVPVDLPFPSAVEGEPVDPQVPTHMSVSQLKSYAECGEKFRLTRIDRVDYTETPAWWLIGGTAVHTAFQRVIVEGLRGDADAAQQAFIDALAEEIVRAEEVEPDRSLWRSAGPRGTNADPLKNKEREEWWTVNGVAQARKFALIYDTPFMPGKVVEIDGVPQVEIEFNIPLGGGMVKGFIDAIMETHTVFPRDYKSGKDEKSAFQLAVYAEALRQAYGIEPTEGQFLMTRTMTLDSWDLTSYTPETLNRLFSNLRTAKEHKVYLPDTSGMFCKSCPVAHACTFKQR